MPAASVEGLIATVVTTMGVTTMGVTVPTLKVGVGAGRVPVTPRQWSVTVALQNPFHPLRLADPLPA
jgi:hypothetical protein